MQPAASVRRRVEYFDFLRILSTLAVVLIHVSAQKWHEVPVNSLQWQVFNLYDCLVRWPVPCFLMISGTLFLNGTHSIGTIARKYLLRILTALAFWSAVYAFVTYVRGEAPISDVIYRLFVGHFHLWYLYVIAGLYLAVPIFRKLVESESVTKYFLLVTFVFGSLIPQISACIGLKFSTAAYIIDTILDQLDLSMVSIYAFYFVLGYCLNKADISPKQQKWIYLLGILSVAFTLLASSLASLWLFTPTDVFYNISSVNVVLTGIAVFTFAKNHFSYKNCSPKVISVLQRLAEYSFGVYLVHMLVLDHLEKGYNFTTVSFHPILSVPVITLAVAAISYLISGIIHKIPVLKKYIV